MDSTSAREETYSDTLSTNGATGIPRGLAVADDGKVPAAGFLNLYRLLIKFLTESLMRQAWIFKPGGRGGLFAITHFSACLSAMAGM